MENESNWNTFTRTGKVSDYLAYVQGEGRSDNSTGWERESKEERGQREGTSDGKSAFGSNHW